MNKEPKEYCQGMSNIQTRRCFFSMETCEYGDFTKCEQYKSIQSHLARNKAYDDRIKQLRERDKPHRFNIN